MRTTALVLMAALAGAAFAQDPPKPDAPASAPADPIETVRAELAAYDAAMAGGGGVDTIPTERAILAAGGAAKPDALVEFAGHRRFGPLVFTVLCERRARSLEPKLLEAFRALEPEGRAETARALAALCTDGVRSALRETAAIDAFLADGPPKAALRAALVRAGDAASVADVRKGLASKDADETARALLLAGDARASVDFLADAARLADDARKLAARAPSQWPDTRVTKSDDGLTTTSESVAVELTTVGDAAVEAANRMFATTLPEWTAWWYELEKGPRFGRGADAVKRLRAFAAEDAKAVKAKAARAGDAVSAVHRALRRKQAEGGDWTLVAVAFDKAWTVTYTLDGAAGTALVDAGGTVTLR